MSESENIVLEFETAVVEEVAPVEEPIEVVPVEAPAEEEAPVVVPVEAPVEEAPAEVQAEEPVEAPVEEEPVVVPVEAPLEEPVVEESVVEEPVVVVPVESVEEVPVEEAPVEEPVEEAPVEEPVVEEPVVEEPVEVPVEPVVEETPVEEVPVVVPVVPAEVPVVPVEGPVPKLIFIVPYRDREEQQRFFDFQMRKVLEDYQKEEYLILYSHQMDQRSFNRGAMKNIGFLYAKSRYPNDYQNITFVFNDVDTMPYSKNLLNYETVPGVVKHFYGYTFTLGGIVSIRGSDIEKTNGYPNYWSWGYEDNAFQVRVNKAGLTIDRSQFYPILDKNILQLKDGITRIVNRGEFDRYVNELQYQNNVDGLNTLSNVLYKYDDNTGFLNIGAFVTPIQENPELNKVHDMREGPTPFQRTPQQRRGRARMGLMF